MFLYLPMVTNTREWQTADGMYFLFLSYFLCQDILTTNVTLHHMQTTRKSPDMNFQLRPDSKRGDSKL